MADHDRNPSEEVVFRVLTGRARDTEKESVAAWRREAQSNEARYQALARVLGLVVGADAHRRRGDIPRAEEIVARAAIEAERRARSHGRRLHRWLFGGIGGAALIVAGLGVSRLLPEAATPAAFGMEEFATGASEAATIGLRDGTVVRLAPKSRLTVLDERAGRTVALTGRAYLAVARDETRPFRVQTPVGLVTVLGTRFDLEAGGDDLRVVVVEGTVAVTARGEDTRVEAGEMGRIVRGKPVPVLKVTDPTSHVDWVGSFLAFQETPFREAAHEITRQYGVEIQFQDSALAERTITAWFADWTLEEVLDVVCPVVNADCARVGDVVHTIPRAH